MELFTSIVRKVESVYSNDTMSNELKLTLRYNLSSKLSTCLIFGGPRSSLDGRPGSPSQRVAAARENKGSINSPMVFA